MTLHPTIELTILSIQVGEIILGASFVEGPEIDTHPPSAIFLLHHYYVGKLGSVVHRFNERFLEQFMYFSLRCLDFLFEIYEVFASLGGSKG